MVEAKWLLLAVIFMFSKNVLSISQECPDKWLSFGSSCYLIVTPSLNYDPDEMSWNGARTYCLKKNADLLSLTTEKEVSFIYSHTKSLDYYFWNGMAQVNRTTKHPAWVWVNRDRVTITKWSGVNEPDTNGGKYCVEILKKSKLWKSQKCDEKRAWICEKAKKIPQKLNKNITAPWKPTVKNKKVTTFTTSSTGVPLEKTRKNTEQKSSKTTPKGHSSNANSSSMSGSMQALFIFLPLILVALIIVIILLVRKNRKSHKKTSSTQDSERQMENQQNNAGFTEVDAYTDLHQNREPENVYRSLDMYEHPYEPYIVANHINYINKPEVTAPPVPKRQRRGFSYVIPPPSHDYDTPALDSVVS